MKKVRHIAFYFITILLVIIACTKDVGLLTEVEFELTEQHTAEGFVSEELPTTLTVVPEAEIEGYEYSFSYEVSTANGHFQDVDGNILQEGAKLALNPFSTSVMYVGSEKGEHTVTVTAEDNFGFLEEIDISYTLTDIPIVWTATSDLEQVELGKSTEITLTLDNSGPDLGTTYESSYETHDGKGRMVSLPDSVNIVLDEFESIVPGTYAIVFYPETLGTIEVTFPLIDSNGQEVSVSLPFEVVENIAVISIDLGEHDEIEMQMGGTLECPVTFVPANATNQAVTWQSSDTSIVTVDGQGTFTAVGIGTATVIATSISNAEAIDTVIVNVVPAPRIPVTGITVTQENPEETGAIRQLVATALPDDATDTSVIWSSDDDEIAMIDENGLLTGLSAGTAIITATSVSDPNIGGSIQVEITGASVQRDTDILTFSLEGQIETATINDVAHTISVTVPEGTSLNVAPSTLTVSEGATVVPDIFRVEDFSSAVQYTVTSGSGEEQIWIVSVTVLDPAGGNQPPTAVNDTRATTVDAPISFDPRSNDTDPENDVLTITEVGTVSPVGAGTVDFDADSITFTPGAGSTETAIFTYTITDGNTDNDATGIVTVTVGASADTEAPVITLNGGDVSITVGEAYNDLGATATDNVDGDISGNIVTTGTVDNNTEGTYTLAYNVSDTAGNAATEVTRTVTVVTGGGGNQPPTAVDDSRATTVDAPISFDPRSNDTDPENDVLTITVVGAVSPAGAGTINFDGQSVTFTPATGSTQTANFTYTINDGNTGNDATATVTVTVVTAPDTEAPIISLNGGDVSITVGETYNDLGATATDNVDGDISGNIVTTGTVDNNTEGTYTLAYNVSDAAGNIAVEVIRTVIVGPVSNNAPVANDDIFTVTENGTLNRSVFTDNGNGVDSDLDIDDVITVDRVRGLPTNVGIPVNGDEGGRFTINSNGDINFDPNGDFDSLNDTEAAPTSITYRISDGNGGSGTATVTVTVTGVSPVNADPIADAGPAQTIALPMNNVTLDGSESSDTAPGTIVSYQWSRIGSGGTANITNPNSVSTTVTGLSEGIYTFRLTVTDNDSASDTDDVVITVEGAPNADPVADAGPAQTIALPTNIVTLDGSGSSDTAPGTIVSYQWSRIGSGGTANITNPNSVSTTVTGLSEGIYTFRLTVTDNDSASDTDDVVITVEGAPNADPVADAGPAQTIALPTNIVTLDGSGSSDTAPGTIVSYQWSRIGSGGTANITNPNSVSTSVTGLTEGMYTFRLTVTDNDSASDTDDVVITVEAAPNADPVADAGEDQSIKVPTFSVTLDGSNSFDSDVGQSISYSWIKVMGGSATIGNANSDITNVSNLEIGIYIFRLTVTDNGIPVLSNSDEVTVTVNDRSTSFNRSTGIYNAPAGSSVTVSLVSIGTGNGDSGTATFSGGGGSANTCWGGFSGCFMNDSYTFTMPSSGMVSFTGAHAPSNPSSTSSSNVSISSNGETITASMNPGAGGLTIP